MTLRFYTDTHIAKQIAIQLRDKGIDVVRCEEVGLAEADDEEHLKYSTKESRILITFDKGFRDRAFNWLAEGRYHSGIFICKPELQREVGIGVIVNACKFYHQLVEQEAATLDDFRNRIYVIGLDSV
jgi:predicted nuclease of predicted toxin-antitoxin system